MEINQNETITQYMKAKEKKTKPNTKQVINEYQLWIEARNKMKKEYIEMLKEIKIDLNNKTTAEVGKNIIDTIALSNDMTIITPYKDIYESIPNKKILLGNMKIYNNTPYLETKNETIIPNQLIDTYMTHNPYNYKEIEEWFKLQYKYNIIIGVFGSIYDKDKDEKIKKMLEIKRKLQTTCTEHFKRNSDSYYYVIKNRR